MRRALTVAVILVLAACANGPTGDELDGELDRVVERARGLARRAAGFDHDLVLETIGHDPANGSLFRLDEHLAEAVHEAPPGPVDVFEPVLGRLDPGDGRAESGGIVSYAVNLPVADVGACELQLQAPPGARVGIELRGERSGDVLTIELDAVGDGAVRAYRLELADAFAKWTGRRLVGLRMRPPAPTGGGAFIFRGGAFLSHASAYADSPYGVTHRRRGREARLALFQRSSSVLRFPLRIDGSVDAATLDLGVSALQGEKPVRVEVTLARGSDRRTLMSATLAPGGEWTDRRLSLGRLDDDEHAIELRVEADAPTVVFWSNPVVVVPRKRRLNVVMVLEDALRADRLSCYGADRPTTPVKDGFARRGVRFARCFAQATKTRFSCPSFMTSLLPTATGVEGIWHPHPSLHSNYITLAEVLRRRGFVTASIHQNPNAGTPAGLDQGFSYLFENIPGRAEEVYAGLPLRWIEAHRDRNFLLYLHLADPHEPYDPPEAFRTWFSELEAGAGQEAPQLDRRDPQWVREARRALYDGEIAANDKWFAVFLERLEELGLADDTLIVFMSDHGEHLGEHGLWSHNPPSYVQVLHTPLIMVYPRHIPSGVVVDEIVQNLDIMPTILDLAGVDVDGLLMQGDSLVPLMTEGATIGWNRNLGYAEEALLKKWRDDPRPYGSIILGRWHVLDSLHAPNRLFDLVLDAAEERPLRTDRQQRATFQAFLRQMQLAELEIWRGVTGGEEPTVHLDPETIDELKALGYLE